MPTRLSNSDQNLISKLTVFTILLATLIAMPTISLAATYTAWVGKPHPTKRNFYTSFKYGYGPSAGFAKNEALRRCGTSCKVLLVRKGCVKYRLRKSGRVLKPRGCKI